MGEPTWQEITAEAIRRKAQALKDGRDAPPTYEDSPAVTVA